MGARSSTSRERPARTALSVRLSTALDELKVFIPPPIQSIIVKLAFSQRGTYTVPADVARAREQL
jgi:hypothetical protein